MLNLGLERIFFLNLSFNVIITTLQLYSKLFLVRHFIGHHLFLTFLNRFSLGYFLFEFGYFFFQLLAVRSEFLHFGKLEFELLLVLTANGADSFVFFFELFLVLVLVFEFGFETEKLAFELHLHPNGLLLNLEQSFLIFRNVFQQLIHVLAQLFCSELALVIFVILGIKGI